MRKFGIFGNLIPVAATNGSSFPVDDRPERGVKPSLYAQQGPNGGGMAPMPQGQGGYGMGNDSGTGATAQLPAELRGLNWGALLLNWIWCIANRSYIGLLCFLPIGNVVMPFVMLVKGNEWAWQNRRWESVEQFQEVQKKWTKWGVGLVVFAILMDVIGGVLGVMLGHHGH